MCTDDIEDYEEATEGEKKEVANRYFKVAMMYLRLNFFYARAKMSTE